MRGCVTGVAGTLKAATGGASLLSLDLFSFNCWVLPAQYDLLRQWGSKPAHASQQYIVKPLSVSAGVKAMPAQLQHQQRYIAT